MCSFFLIQEQMHTSLLRLLPYWFMCCFFFLIYTQYRVHYFLHARHLVILIFLKVTKQYPFGSNKYPRHINNIFKPFKKYPCADIYTRAGAVAELLMWDHWMQEVGKSTSNVYVHKDYSDHPFVLCCPFSVFALLLTLIYGSIMAEIKLCRQGDVEEEGRF